MNSEERAILLANIESSIESILTEKKLKYISDTMEFVEGLLVGMEVAKLYGDKIHELYMEKNTNES